MKKHIPLLILTLFIGGCTSTSPPILGVAVPPPVLPEDGIKHTLISSSDTPWEGVITEGTKEKGRGIFIATSGKAKGNWYEGEFVGIKVHGQGTMTWKNGQKYVGEWKLFKPHGQGTYTLANGAKYVGEFKDNKYHGQGTMTWANGRKYVGEWKLFKPHGQGTYTLADGTKYVGEFKDGNRHGQGTVTTPDGSKYVGEFKDDKVHIAVFYPVNGEPQSGIFNDGNLQTPWTIEAVSSYLKDKYPEFSGFDSETSAPISTSVKSSGKSISGFIAVLEFEGNNISSGEVRALTDRLRTELVGTGELTIIERGKMEEVLKEQSFQQTGCISSECAVEVGKLLGVEQIVSGNISKVGNYFSVTARVVSVTTGEIVRSTIYDHSGDIGGLLTQGMRKVAEELGK